MDQQLVDEYLSPSLQSKPSPSVRHVYTTGCPGYPWYAAGHTLFNATETKQTLRFPLNPVLSTSKVTIGTGKCQLGAVGVALNGAYLFR